jgi:hypothetical protein
VQEDRKKVVEVSEPPMGGGAQKQNTLGALADIDPEQHVKEKFPSLRFSEEISYLVTVLNTTLKGVDFSKEHLDKCKDEPALTSNKEDQIASLILGLIFKAPMRKIHAKYDLYLYPYLLKIKLLMLIDELVSTTHKINIENVFRTLEAYMCGATAFPEFKQANPQWH